MGEKIILQEAHITDISDALTLGNNSIVADILKIGENVAEQGGTVIIQRQYENAPPDLLAKYSTAEELKRWKEHLNKTQQVLDRPPIK